LTTTKTNNTNSYLFQIIHHLLPKAGSASGRLPCILEADGRNSVSQYDPFGNRTRETITNITDPQASGGSPKAYWS